MNDTDNDISAKTVLYQENSRRRTYLSSVIVGLNTTALMGTIAIWKLFVKWDLQHSLNTTDKEQFALSLALAGTISSILIGLWRLYARYIDNEIISLYPTIYMYESSFMDNRICTIKHPNKINPNQEMTNWNNINCEDFKNSELQNSDRGHNWFDTIAAFIIFFLGVISIYYSYEKNVITISFQWPPHIIGFLLVGNIIGIGLVVWGVIFWRRQKHFFPTFGLEDNMSENEKKKELINKLNVSDWNLSKEREFMENLYVGRFNYFLIVFSLFITAGFANNYKSLKSIVFYAGALLLFMVWLLLHRGYKKLDLILKLIFNDMKDHPANILEALMKLDGHKPKYRVSKWMGVYIPLTCIAFLILAGLLVNIGVLK